MRMVKKDFLSWLKGPAVAALMLAAVPSAGFALESEDLPADMTGEDVTVTVDVGNHGSVNQHSEDFKEVVPSDVPYEIKLDSDEGYVIHSVLINDEPAAASTDDKVIGQESATIKLDEVGSDVDVTAVFSARTSEDDDGSDDETDTGTADGSGDGSDDSAAGTGSTGSDGDVAGSGDGSDDSAAGTGSNGSDGDVAGNSNGSDDNAAGTGSSGSDGDGAGSNDNSAADTVGTGSTGSDSKVSEGEESKSEAGENTGEDEEQADQSGEKGAGSPKTGDGSQPIIPALSAAFAGLLAAVLAITRRRT